MTINQIIIKVKMNRILLFNRIEQGRGKYSNRVYLYFKQNSQQEVKEWIQKFYGNEFKTNSKIIYKTSVKVNIQEEQTINQATNDNILKQLKEIDIEEKSTRLHS